MHLYTVFVCIVHLVKLPTENEALMFLHNQTMFSITFDYVRRALFVL